MFPAQRYHLFATLAPNITIGDFFLLQTCFEQSQKSTDIHIEVSQFEMSPPSSVPLTCPMVHCVFAMLAILLECISFTGLSAEAGLTQPLEIRQLRSEHPCFPSVVTVRPWQCSIPIPYTSLPVTYLLPSLSINHSHPRFSPTNRNSTLLSDCLSTNLFLPRRTVSSHRLFPTLIYT